MAAVTRTEDSPDPHTICKKSAIVRMRVREPHFAKFGKTARASGQVILHLRTGSPKAPCLRTHLGPHHIKHSFREFDGTIFGAACREAKESFVH